MCSASPATWGRSPAPTESSRWRPVIDRQFGREVMGVVQGGSVLWRLGRQRGLGL
ncbi:DUF3363 domain-containing protein [Pseudomonas aeruginosa]|nr:DUF3363 domain-containing protein [Pseudomonas juntendi]UXA41335.1 DUF3363 domain-containing protein [Pseudomonas juntendi]